MSSQEVPAISDAEWEVMKVLWEKGPMAARDVFKALAIETKWSIQTVKTLLSRLAAKGAVEYDQVGNSYLYRAAVKRDAVTHKETKGFLNRVFDGAAFSFLAHFVESDAISDEELEKLQQVIEQRKRKEGKDEPGC